jgi:hypothetical protein
VEYYDLGGRLLKTQMTGRHELIEPEKSRWFVLYREMTNHQTKHRTTFNGDQFDPKPSVPDELFTTRYIERE